MKNYCVDGYIDLKNKKKLTKIILDMCLTNITIGDSRGGISFYKNCSCGATVMCIDVKTGISPDAIRESFQRFLKRQKLKELRNFEFYVWEKL